MATVTELGRGPDAESLTRPLIVTSCDSHAGPRLNEELRAYCPIDRLTEFDDYCKAREGQFERAVAMFKNDSPEMQKVMRLIMQNMRTEGHYDMGARLREMDKDGVAAEVIFHNSNGQPIPFLSGQGTDMTYDPELENLELAAVGMRMYNRWLAEACKTDPDRLLGAIVPPAWDPEASADEVEWGARAGLRVVALPVMRDGIPPYDYPAWERFWAVCADHDLILCTHGGGTMTAGVGLPHEFVYAIIEQGAILPRRTISRLLFGGVFERYPNLRLILAEQASDWWVNTLREYDSAYLNQKWRIGDILPRMPSDYMRSNVFIGASFMAPFEARGAVDGGFVDNMMWGRDFPHPEGCYQFREDGDDDPWTNPSRLSMRFCFAEIPPSDIRKMVGGNGLKVLGLDERKMQAIADRIGAPSIAELTTPIEAIPENGGYSAFRKVGWGA